MYKTLLKVLGLLACLAWLSSVSAANMGGINVTSALGFPLKAEISLAEMGKSDKSTLVAKLASVNDFKSAGLDYPYSLPKLTFVIETRSNGEAYIRLTSTQPVNEPFVSLLIELSWPSGKVLREYTFLLDPAGFTPEQPRAAEVKPVEPMLPAVAPLPIAAPVVAPEVAVLPVEPAAVAALPLEEEGKPELAGGEMTQAGVEAKPARELSDMEKAELAAIESEKVVEAPAEPGKVEPAEFVKVEPLAPTPKDMPATGSILVEKGDTLGKIAEQVKPVEVSLERMLVAMYRVNAKTFDGKNMNRIRAGKILRMPESEDIEKVTQSAAVKEIRAQVADWQDYRQKLAAAQSNVTEQAPKQEAAGKINAAVAEKAPVIKDSAKEVLKLSKGESLGDKAVAGAAKSKQEKMAEKADDAAAKSKQMKEEQKKIEKLEVIKKEASKLVELKGSAVAPQDDVNNLPASAPVAVAKKSVPVASAVPATQTESADFDILEFIPEDPMILGAGLAVMLGLGGLVYVRTRKGKGTQKKSSKKIEEVGSATGSWRTPVAPSPDTGDFTQYSAPSPSAPMSVAAALDDVDPISEADLFLNFGRDAQAEEILKDALSKNPSNVQVKLKLLSIYVTRKDNNSFSKYAQEVKDSGDASAWERAAVMGRELDPSNPTYGGVKGEVRHREPVKAEVDFDLGLGKPAAETNREVAAKDFKMDFDLTGSQPSVSSKSADFNDSISKLSGVTRAKATADVDATSILSREAVYAAEAATPMDFDVSGILPNDVKQVAQSSTMDFDISGMLPEETKGIAPSLEMDFDLSGMNHQDTAVLAEPIVNTAPASSSMDFNDLVFEIPTSEPVAAPKKVEVAADEGMAFTIDFPTSDSSEAPSSKSTSAGKLDIDFGDININLDDESAAHPGGEGKDEHWHEVATKLDLAKAYQEMGDADGAREILEEVIRDGDNTQRESAEKLLQNMAA